jgi:hypothetical protein
MNSRHELEQDGAVPRVEKVVAPHNALDLAPMFGVVNVGPREDRLRYGRQARPRTREPASPSTRGPIVTVREMTSKGKEG